MVYKDKYGFTYDIEVENLAVLELDEDNDFDEDVRIELSELASILSIDEGFNDMMLLADKALDAKLISIYNMVNEVPAATIVLAILDEDKNIKERDIIEELYPNEEDGFLYIKDAIDKMSKTKQRRLFLAAAGGFPLLEYDSQARVLSISILRASERTF